MADLTITGTHATNTSDAAPVLPFTGVTVTDPNVGATEKLTLRSLGFGSNGTLTYAASYTGPRTLTSSFIGDYELTGTASQVTQELDALVYTPDPLPPGNVQTTTISLEDFSSATNYTYGEGGYAFDSATEVTNSTPPDTVSISPQVTYRNGVFTLSGDASSVLGVTTVDIQAIVDGVPTDLGTAAVDANGQFTFADRVGPHTQTYITAIEMDTAGYSPARDTAPLLLKGGLQQGTVRAEQDVYSSDGSAVTSVSHFQRDGLKTTDVLASDLTLEADYTDTFNNNFHGSNTFVYDPGHGTNVVTEILLRGAQHDLLSFNGSDFGNSIANVLAHAYGPGDGSGVVIVDPTTHDTVQLAGISKRGLVANQGDIEFHA